MPPRSASWRTLARLNKSTAVAAIGETRTSNVGNHESQTEEEKTGAKLADAVVVKVEENKEIEQLVKGEGSNRNHVEIFDISTTSSVNFEDSVVSVSPELVTKEEVILDNWALDHVNIIGNQIGEEEGLVDKEKEDLGRESESADKGEQGVGVGNSEGGDVCVDDLRAETVGEINIAQEETTAAQVDNSKVPCDNSSPLVVGVIGDGQGEKIAELISAPNSAESDNAKGLCENSATLVVTDGGNGKGEGMAEIISAPESAQADGTEAPCENITTVKDKESGDNEDNDNNSEVDNEDSEGDEDPFLFAQDPLPDRKKVKDIEIYVGRLNKGTVEDDLINVFQKFGELKSTRIVRNSTTMKSKGFAFVRFASVDQAKHALSELKDGIEVRGKHVNVSASQDNDTLHVGNICKTWTKEDVLKQLEHYGIEHVEDIHLPDDPNNNGKIRGFALLQFGTHTDAMVAFIRLRKPDVVFGYDRSAKVAFTQTPMHANEELLSQVKRVYVEGLTKTWNVEKLKDFCKQYGEIVKVKSCKSSGIKNKYIGFVTFSSHESALACVDGINCAGIGEEVKIKACIAKPHRKGRLQKQGFRGGFKVEKQSEVESSKQAESSNIKGDLNYQQPKRKREASSEQRVNSPPEFKICGRSPKKLKNDNEGQNSVNTSKAGKTNSKRKKASRYEGREDGGIRHGYSKRPFKKQKGNMPRRERGNCRNPKRDTCIRKGRDNNRNSTTYGNPYAPTYAASGGHWVPASASTSTSHYTEMNYAFSERHAGYIKRTSVEQVQSCSGHVHPITHSQPRTLYLEPAAGSQSQLHPTYVDRTVVTQSHRGYIETPVGAQVQPYGGYRQPAIVQIAHNLYNPGFARAAQHDGRVTSGPAFVGGPPLSVSHVPNHASCAGHQAAGTYRAQGTYY